LQGHIDVVRRLLANGADVKKESTDGRTALAAATAGGHADISALLTEAVQKQTTAKVPEFPDLQGSFPGEVTLNPKDGLAYVWIPPGKFMMGCSPGDTDCKLKAAVIGGEYDNPPQAVEITHGFWIGQTDVTVGAWKKRGKSLPGASVTSMVDNRALALASGWSNYPGWSSERQPMIGLTLHDAREFCESEGLRLPTEEEWEFAARAGTTTARYGNLDDIAWDADNSGRERIDSETLWRTAPVRKNYVPPGDKYRELLKKNDSKPHDVGLKQPNAWKLYDMLGNVWQWTASYESTNIPASLVPPGTSNKITGGVERGGSWYDPPSFVRVSIRRQVIIPLAEFEGITDFSSRDTISGAVRCVGQ
jgi:formylglycine-generating enzyme required for sulfatase activity